MHRQFPHHLDEKLVDKEQDWSLSTERRNWM